MNEFHFDVWAVGIVNLFALLCFAVLICSGGYLIFALFVIGFVFDLFISRKHFFLVHIHQTIYENGRFFNESRAAAAVIKNAMSIRLCSILSMPE